MPPKDITLAQDETFTGGLCLVGTDPVSNFIMLEQWHRLVITPPGMR